MPSGPGDRPRRMHSEHSRAWLRCKPQDPSVRGSPKGLQPGPEKSLQSQAHMVASRACPLMQGVHRKARVTERPQRWPLCRPWWIQASQQLLPQATWLTWSSPRSWGPDSQPCSIHCTSTPRPSRASRSPGGGGGRQDGTTSCCSDGLGFCCHVTGEQAPEGQPRPPHLDKPCQPTRAKVPLSAAAHGQAWRAGLLPLCSALVGFLETPAWLLAQGGPSWAPHTWGPQRAMRVLEPAREPLRVCVVCRLGCV